MIELSAYEEQIITQKLPPHWVSLKSKYPSAVYNAASAQELPILEPGYRPRLINIFYGEEDNPHYLPNISFQDGKLELLFLTEECADNPVIQIQIDGCWAYIEIEKQILLNRVENVSLPKLEEITAEEIAVVCQKHIHLF